MSSISSSEYQVAVCRQDGKPFMGRIMFDRKDALKLAEEKSREGYKVKVWRRTIREELICST